MDPEIDFELLCPTFRPQLAAGLVDSVTPVGVTVVNGSGAKSFAALCNTAISGSDSKYVLIANDKSRPTQRDVDRTLSLLYSGYGLVGLYRMGFFGVRKEVLEYIGGFDELFSDGGFEDNDIYLRLKYNDIGMYLTEEIHYLDGRPSSWPQQQSRQHFFQKYNFGIFSKAIFANLATLSPAVNSSRPAGLKGWQESVFDIIPLETKKSGFENFLKNGWFVENDVRGSLRVGVNRVSRALINLAKSDIPPLLEWKHYLRGRRSKHFRL